MYDARVHTATGEEAIPTITAADVPHLLARLAEDGDFLVVERPGDGEFIQVMRGQGDPSPGWIVEYRAGEEGPHFRADVESRDWIAAVIGGWIEGRPVNTSGGEWSDITAELRPSLPARLFHRLTRRWRSR